MGYPTRSRDPWTVAWLIFTLPVMSAATEDCSQHLIRKARSEIHQTIKKSKNHLPISRYLAESEFGISPSAASEVLGELGHIQFTTHIKTGKSTIELVNKDSATRTLLFSTDELTGSQRSGRIAAIHLSQDAQEIVVDFRAYKNPDRPMIEIRRKLPASAPLKYAKAVLIDPRQVIESRKLKDGSALTTFSYGMNASTDLTLISPDGAAQILFSTFQNARNGSIQLSDVSVSPDERFIAFRSYENGSLDQFTLKVYDRKLGREVYSGKAGSAKLTWLDDGTLQHQEYSAEPGEKLIVARLDRPIIPIEPAPKQIADFSQEIGRIGNEVYYLAAGGYDDPKGIKAISIEDRKRGDASRARSVVSANPNFIWDQAKILDDAIVIEAHEGPRKARMIIDSQGRTLASFWVPECCRLGGIKWKEKGQTLTLTFSSAVNRSLKVDFDIQKKIYSDPDFKSKLMKYNGKSYVSSIEEVTSLDGAKVPVRITRLKDLTPNADRPVYINVYGGFKIENSGFSPNFDSISRKFLERGGILVSPGIRGGNEYGEAWHKAAVGLNKKNTYDDVAATADYLIQKGWTSGKKIILTGTSNGGLTAAATALQHPELFGLVIPINGVLDLVQAETWDRKFRGWSSEYGSNSDANTLANKQKLSPMLQAQKLPSDQDFPEFFIVNGENDSRVDARHSQNFYAALTGTNSDEITAHLLVLPHAGHWLASPAYQKAIGWHTKSAIWTRIFDYLGWEF